MLQLRPLKLVVSSLLHRDDEKHHRRRVAILETSQQDFREYIVFSVDASAGSLVASKHNAPEICSLQLVFYRVNSLNKQWRCVFGVSVTVTVDLFRRTAASWR